jgi:streptogramin lyase
MCRCCGHRYHHSHPVRPGCGRSYDWLVSLSQNVDKQRTQVQLLQDWKMKTLLLISLLLAGRLLAQPVITTQPMNQIALNGSNVVFSVAVSGTGPFTYQWQFNGTNLPNAIIATVAGGGSGGDGGPANQASLNYPCGVATDATGNYYIADTDSGLVRKVNTNGVIITVAGGGTNFPGDGAAATNASFSLPFSIALDTAGNIYIADTLNRRVCKVDPNGIITTLAGNGTYGSSGDGGPATNALLAFPYGVAVDNSGNVYISDSDANGIRKVDSNGIITRVVGSTPGFYGDGGPAINAGLLLPDGITLDGLGNMYIADSSNNRIRKVDTLGIITTVAGGGSNYPGDGGPATSASLGGNPSGVATDASGNLFVADSFENRVCEVNSNGILTTLADYTSLYEPRGLAVDGLGNLLIADASNGRVREIAFTKSPILKMNNVSTNEAGSYSVVVTSSSGSVTSSIVDLTVVYPPQPQMLALPIGSSGSFTLSGASSGLLNYQWYFNTNTAVPDGTNSVLNFISASTNLAGNYLCVVINSYGSITSAVVTLLVGVPAGIANQPHNQSMTNGGFVTFSVGASGDTPLNYQWYFNNSAINGETNTVLNIINVTNSNGGNYFCMVTNLFGSATSGVATLTILLPPSISSQPQGQQVGIGSNGVFTVTCNGTLPFNYQWLFNGEVIADATNYNYNFNVVGTNQAGSYSVIIANNYGSVTSSVAMLTVLLFPPVIASQPASQTLPAGSNATFNVIASGSPPFGYQWLLNGASLDGQTNSTFSLPNVTTNQAGAYSVWVYSPYGSVTSHIATLTVGWLPTITSQPTNQTLLSGSRALMVAGVSGVGPLTFQWQLNGTNLPNNLITTIAGNGTAGFAGDGGIATTGKVNFPYGVAADGAGNVFIVDSSSDNFPFYPPSNYRIRKVNTNGVMTTVAGNGQLGFSGDGGAATNARLNTSYGIAVDGMGNLFIADTYNNRIRKVDTNGIITTVAGKSSSGFSGDGGAATNARLYYPYGVMVDTNGNLFIADTYNNRIRKVDTNGVITTVAGKSSSGFSGDCGAATNANLYRPQSVAMDGNGNLFIADAYNYRVRQVDVYEVITTIAGNGSTSFSGDNGVATNAGMNPFGVSVDGYGDVLIADRSNNRIRRVDPYGIVTTVAGTNGSGFNGDGVNATNATLNYVCGVAMDSFGRILIADTGNNRIRRFGQGPTLVFDNLAATNAGNYTLVVSSSYGSVTSEVATLTVLLPPAFVSPLANQTAGLGSNTTFTVSVTGTAPLIYQWQMSGTNLPGQTGQSLNLTNVKWSDAGSYTVIITNNYGSVTSSVVTLTVGWPPALISQPTNLMVSAGSNVWLSVQVSGDGPFTYQWQLNGTNLPPIITTFAGTNAGGYSGDGGIATNAKLSSPRGVCVDKRGNVYIAENGNSRVRRVDTNGIITTFAGTGTSSRSGDGGQATNANLLDVSAVSADVTDNIFIVGSYDIRKVNSNGIITPVAGYGSSMVDGVVATNAYIGGATCVTIDHQENIFFAESGYHRIRKIGTNGIVTTIGGNPNGSTIGGFSGDGGPATNAALGGVNGITVDDGGNVYFSDTGNGRIRKVDVNGIINTIAGGGTNSADGILGTNKYLNWPSATCVHGTDLFFGANSRVLKMDNNGIVTTVAGGGAYNRANNGDYGAATNAYLDGAYGIAFDALGNMLIADGSWRVRKVHFSGDPTLYLPNSGTNKSGVYTVLITSPYGSVTSSNVTLTVITPPIIASVLPNVDGSVTLNLSGMTNFSSRLYAATNLTPPIIWTPISTNPSGGAWQFTDTNAPGQPVQFYRVSTP